MSPLWPEHLQHLKEIKAMSNDPVEREAELEEEEEARKKEEKEEEERLKKQLEDEEIDNTPELDPEDE